MKSLRLGLGLTLVLTPMACFKGDDTGAEDMGTGESSGDGDTGDGDGDTASGDGDGDTASGDGDGDTASGDGDGDTGPGVCDPGLECVEEPIAGWEGPLAIYVGPAGDPAPACQGELPEKVAELFADLKPNMMPGTCECECGPVTDFSCADASLRQHGTSNCLSLVTSWSIAEDECQALGGIQGNAKYSVNQPDMLSADCPAGTVAGITPASHDTKVVACSVGAEAMGCDGGVCMSPPGDPFDTKICIASEGDVLCPDGAYQQRTVYHGGVQDDRSCGACSCGAAPNASCEGEVRLLSNTNDCGFNSFLLGTVPTGGCSAAVSGPDHATFKVTAADQPPCMPSGGGIEGDITETDPWTICCM